MITQQSKHPYTWITAFFLLMWLLLTIRLDTPWTGHHDQNGVWISSAVANYERYGAAELGYLQVINPGPTTPATYSYYVNHPPLIVWSTALFSEVFGRYDDGKPIEALVRLVAVFSTMMSMAAFYVINRRLFANSKARYRPLWTTALYGFTPMILYFGRMPNHEPIALMFIMLFVAIFINWMRQPTLQRWLAMLALAALAMWSAWAAAFLFAALGLVALIYGTNHHRRWILALGGLTILFTLAIPAFYQSQYDGALDALAEAFNFRTSNQEFSRNSESFTLIQFVAQVLTHMLNLMSILVFVMGFIGLWQLTRQRKDFVTGVIFALIIGTIGYMLVFRNAFFIHDYYKIYFLPGMTLAASVGIMSLRRAPRRGILRYARPFVFSCVVVSIGMTIFVLGLLHNSGRNTYTLDLTDVMTTYTTTDDYVATNLKRQNSAVEYYAFRNVNWSQNPQQIVEASSTQNTMMVYLYCPSGPNDELESTLATMPYTEILGTCRVISFR